MMDRMIDLRRLSPTIIKRTKKNSPETTNAEATAEVGETAGGSVPDAPIAATLALIAVNAAAAWTK